MRVLKGIAPRWVPPHSEAPEALDDDAVDPRLVRDNLGDIARAGRWTGAYGAIAQQIARWLAPLPAGYTPTILDVATGRGDLPLLLSRRVLQQERPARLLASDRHAVVLREARRQIARQAIVLLRHDALALPFVDNAVDIVTCAQTLHHFSGVAVRALLRELLRVARLGVIISDVRRSAPALWGARLLGAISVSPVSRRDGPRSVLRAYTPAELEALMCELNLPARLRATPVRLDLIIWKGCGVDGGAARCA